MSEIEMARKLGFRRKRKEYSQITMAGRCGPEIACKDCHYIGPADVIKSNVLSTGELDRCPECKSLNYFEVAMIEITWKIDEWQGCYPSNWKGVIIPESMSHPAKYSSKLIRKIYEHMKEDGWLKEGDMILDPFGGVGLGALDAMRLGLKWWGNELESKFVELGGEEYQCRGISVDFWKRYYLRTNYISMLRQAKLLCPACEAAMKPETKLHKDFGFVKSRKINTRDSHVYRGNIPGWIHKFSSMPGFGIARLTRGDSRFLLDILHGQNGHGAISSPPYADGAQHTGGNDPRPEKMQGGTYHGVGIHGAVSSPPYRDTELTYRKNGLKVEGKDHYGATDGQLGAMKAEGFEAAISSPPFRHSEGGTPEPKPGGVIDVALYARHAAGNSAAEGYGGSDGQLANMPEGDFEGAVSSPPYNLPMSQDNGKRGGERGTTPSEVGAFVKYGNTPGQLEGMSGDGFEVAVSSPPFERTVLHDGGPVQQQGGELHSDYGDTEGHIGNDSGDDFWLAARQIVEQVYLALAPGAHAAWVVKGFVKDKKYVDFPDQWRRLCESVGFVTLHEHRALLVHSKGKQHTIDGGVVEKTVQSKSFFRRLAEKKGSPRVDWETVYCMVKEVKS